jgi:hypothetical protein
VFFSSNDDSLWLLNVHLLYELVIEEHCLHVHVMDLPALIHRKSEDQPDGLHACQWSKDLIKVDVSLLHVPLCDETRLVLDHYVYLILLHF